MDTTLPTLQTQSLRIEIPTEKKAGRELDRIDLKFEDYWAHKFKAVRAAQKTYGGIGDRKLTHWLQRPLPTHSCPHVNDRAKNAQGDEWICDVAVLCKDRNLDLIS